MPKGRKEDGQLKRFVRAAATAVLGLAVVPAVASATTVTGAAGSITFAADPGETNVVTITPTGTDTYTVTDPAQALTGAVLCTDDGSPAAGEPVTCGVAGLTDVTVTLGDLDDSVDTSDLPATVDSGLDGGAGDDSLHGGAGDDAIDGGVGTSDRVLYTEAPGGVGVHLNATPPIATGHGADSLANLEDATGSAFVDTLNGSVEDNSLDGGGGDDLINPAPVGGDGGDDTLIGGPGSADLLNYAQSTSGRTFDTTGSPTVTGDGTTDAFSGFELAFGSSFPDTYAGGAGVDNFDGSGGPDTIAGGGQDDILAGGGNNDTLAGNGGIDQLSGGTGTGDTAAYSSAAGPVTSSLTTQTTAADGDGASDSLSEIENLTGSNHGDDLTGSSLVNTINALDGADTVRVRDSGADSVDCGAASDLAITDASEMSFTACETIDDPSPTPTPSIIGSNPPSGADDNAPRIAGAAPAGSTVNLFTSVDCSGPPVATGSAADFISPGLTVAVADNSTTTLYASAASADIDGPSGCSGAFTYVESSTQADLTAPQTTIKKPIRKTTDRTPTFKLSSSEGGSTFECKVDKGKYSDCGAKETLKKLQYGKHTFYARATDAAGNADQTPAKDKFVVRRRKS